MWLSHESRSFRKGFGVLVIELEKINTLFCSHATGGHSIRGVIFKAEIDLASGLIPHFCLSLIMLPSLGYFIIAVPVNEDYLHRTHHQRDTACCLPLLRITPQGKSRIL